jgi:mono/diheme cytochrome c family protein
MNLTRICVAAAFALAADVPISFAAPDLKQGEALLTRNCSRCHAVGPAGASPLPNAPAFRTLGTRYPIESLEEALGEGIVAGHPDMPEMSFDAGEVGAIIDYLSSIQAR